MPTTSAKGEHVQAEVGQRQESPDQLEPQYSDDQLSPTQSTDQQSCPTQQSTEQPSEPQTQDRPDQLQDQHLEGPDQLVPANAFTSTDCEGFVELRMGKSEVGQMAKPKLEGGQTTAKPAEEDPANFTPVSVPTLLRQVAEQGGSHIALAVKRDDQWHKWTYHRYHQEVRTVAKAFVALGLKPRHAVAILGFNSPEWFFSDLAAVFAGGVATGIYPTNSTEASKYIALHSRANILVVENEKQLEKILPFKEELPELKAIVQYTGTPTRPDVISWQQLLELGETQPDEPLEDRLRHVAINQCCHLVYTSGTTGPPKAVMLSHDNITFTAAMTCKAFKLTKKTERYVSYLPLSHVAANVCDIFVMMSSMSTVYFADKDALKGTLVATLKEALPTVFLGVPRVWEKMQEKMMEVGKANKGIKRQIGQWAKKTGLRHNQKILAGRGGNVVPSWSYKIADKIAFQKVKQALGLNKCHGFYAAAAPMSKDTLQYFLSLDMRILEIYGMSECSGPQLTNTHDEQKLGAIGKSFPGFSTTIKRVLDDEINEAEGGEICMRGRNVMMGYMGNEDKTREAIDPEGWLHSGDLGVKDEDDYFFITGRLKEIIITAGGENVPPVVIEDNLRRELPILSNAMLIGDRRKFLSCLLTLKVEVDQDSLEPQSELSKTALDWCESLGSKAQTVQDVINGDAIVLAAIQAGVDRTNLLATSNAQRIQKWHILAKDFSVPGGELGPTLKLKRHAVLARYQDRVDMFYA